ncbi:MAG: c-type cytochrome [Phycisphaerales bacterium]|nr:MAG: c-type cytochrome [Phycisphaerales bacterium]
MGATKRVWVMCGLVVGLSLTMTGAARAQGNSLMEVPKGLPPLPVPADNPMTEAKVELGRMLYFDTRLSSSGTISCATCHDPTMAWTEHRATSKGLDEQVGERNSPTVINAAYMTSQFWDGRSKTLEEQALGPIENPVEMGHKMEVLTGQLEEIPEYKKRFADVFGTEVNKEGIAKAIAAFERTVLSGNSPYDQYQAGDKNALTEAQVNGMDVFMSACATCHTPPTFSNGRFYNAGVGADKAKPDEGRKKVSGKARDTGAFRVPHLREVASTWPYFHDGSVEKLEDAVALMARGGNDSPGLSMMMKAVRGMELEENEIADMVEFLKALSGDYPVVEPPKLP